MTFEDRARNIEIILSDVDGTLTNGDVTFDVNGNVSKTFCIRDGLAIRLWREQGFKFGFVSGDDSPATAARAKQLSLDYTYLGRFDKSKILNKFIDQGIDPATIAFIGDDLIDAPILSKVGLSVIVADAVPELKELAHYITKKTGGTGAAREVVELILKAKGQWQETIKPFFR